MEFYSLRYDEVYGELLDDVVLDLWVHDTWVLLIALQNLLAEYGTLV